MRQSAPQQVDEDCVGLASHAAAMQVGCSPPPFPCIICNHSRSPPMVEVPITIACGNYDRTGAIQTSRARVEGCAVTYLPLYPEEIFFRAFRYREFDVSELSFSSYIRTVAAGTSAYVGISPSFARTFSRVGV